VAEHDIPQHFLTAGPVPSPPPRYEGLEVLSRHECRQLLAGGGFGRVAVSVGALPAVLPVRFVLAGGEVVFPAAPGGELDLAVRDAVVAFEADHFDPAAGWSVVVAGVATEIRDPAELRRLRAVPALAEATDEAPCLFRVSAEMLSGRRLLAWPLHVAGTVLAASAHGAPAEAGSPADATPTPLDGSRLEPITEDECLRLLSTEEVGRLVVVLDGRPQVFPVNYALDGDAVVFRTAPGTKLEAITRSLVAFEVDRLSPSATGWKVVVEGIAQEVTSADGPSLRERIAAFPSTPGPPATGFTTCESPPYRSAATASSAIEPLTPLGWGARRAQADSPAERSRRRPVMAWGTISIQCAFSPGAKGTSGRRSSSSDRRSMARVISYVDPWTSTLQPVPAASSYPSISKATRRSGACRSLRPSSVRNTTRSPSKA
jgi:uncharacterized protein